MTDVAEIAQSLTKAQRETMLEGVEGISIGGSGWLRQYGRLCDAGLLRRSRWRIMGKGKLTHSATYHATERGLAVRDYLKEQG